LPVNPKPLKKADEEELWQYRTSYDGGDDDE
jgi:hypothetical protein